MAFFNKKEEVLDIKLTQFGKESLARGVFKPVYYAFFDDDILYDLAKARGSEHQNKTEPRILQETPRLKTIHLSYGVETKYKKEDEEILARTRHRFMPLDRNFDPVLQEKLLTYQLGNKETGTQDSPAFSLVSKDASFSETVNYLTSSGIINKIPQIEMSASLLLVRDPPQQESTPARALQESHFDLLGEEIFFLDGSRLSRYGSNLSIDIEETNSFYGLENFEIEIFEIKETDSGESLERIEDQEEIKKLFAIKTDEDVKSVENLDLKSTNYRRRGD